MIKRTDSYHHKNLRRELLKAAMSLLDEKGVAGVTIRETARRTGVAHSAPANHFANRKSLLTAIATEIFKTLGQRITAQLASAGPDPEERIRCFAESVITYGLKHPHRFRLLWLKDNLDNSDESLVAAMDMIYENLVSELTAAVSSRVSPESQAISLWAMVHGYVCMRLDGNLVSKTDEKTGELRQHAIVTALLDGLSPSRRAR